MGFVKRKGLFHLKCDVCGKTASGLEMGLIDEGWSWGKMDITMNGERHQINYAGCSDHDGSGHALEMLKKFEKKLQEKGEKDE